MLRPVHWFLMLAEPKDGGTETQRIFPSAQHRQLILDELEAILANPHFRGSKRYPALLKYVVDATLDQRTSDLKERTLGVEVFGRQPDYDTNSDPVVRISAGEVRKRIAQYYHENGHHSRVQIELPLGSYTPEFRLREPEPAPVQPWTGDREPRSSNDRAGMRGARLLAVLALAAILGGAAASSLVSYHDRRVLPIASGKPATLDELWAPLLQTARPVLIVLRTAPPARVQAASDLSLGDHVHYVSVSIAISLAHLASVLSGHGKSYEVKEALETDLTDIRSRPVILVGAKDNDWTMRLVRPLRFHFVFFPDGMERIEDAANPQQTSWEFNRNTPYSSVTTDYAIVARIRDATSEGPVMVIAGLGSYGTEAAADFVQSPQYLAQLSKSLPPGWENRNFEVVLSTAVIGYHAGPPILLSATSW